jgi:8-oxo-dGTP diphosphatase
MAQPGLVLAAGAVVLRKAAPGEWEVLLVHRPRYDDWSFPKGKLDRGEAVAAAAVREVLEETGLAVHLGPPLPPQEYDVQRRPKRVHYWVARVHGSDDVSAYRPNHEIDDVRWVPVAKAEKRLTYERDRVTLAKAVALRRRTRALVLLRHGKAWDRRSFKHDDRLRPLMALGIRQAERAVPVLAAYGVDRLVSSSSTRCVQSLTPYAAATGLPLELRHGLTEEDATPDGVAAILEEVLAAGVPTVVCSHRPVFPDLYAAAGVDKVKLEPGGMLVVHHRKGRPVATELVPAQ